MGRGNRNKQRHKRAEKRKRQRAHAHNQSHSNGQSAIALSQHALDDFAGIFDALLDTGISHSEQERREIELCYRNIGSKIFRVALELFDLLYRDKPWRLLPSHLTAFVTEVRSSQLAQHVERVMCLAYLYEYTKSPSDWHEQVGPQSWPFVIEPSVIEEEKTLLADSPCRSTIRDLEFRLPFMMLACRSTRDAGQKKTLHEALLRELNKYDEVEEIWQECLEVLSPLFDVLHKDRDSLRNPFIKAEEFPARKETVLKQKLVDDSMYQAVICYLQHFLIDCFDENLPNSAELSKFPLISEQLFGQNPESFFTDISLRRSGDSILKMVADGNLERKMSYSDTLKCRMLIFRLLLDEHRHVRSEGTKLGFLYSFSELLDWLSHGVPPPMRDMASKLLPEIIDNFLSSCDWKDGSIFLKPLVVRLKRLVPLDYRVALLSCVYGDVDHTSLSSNAKFQHITSAALIYTCGRVTKAVRERILEHFYDTLSSEQRREVVLRAVRDLLEGKAFWPVELCIFENDFVLKDLLLRDPYLATTAARGGLVEPELQCLILSERAFEGQLVGLGPLWAWVNTNTETIPPLYLAQFMKKIIPLYWTPDAIADGSLKLFQRHLDNSWRPEIKTIITKSVKELHGRILPEHRLELVMALPFLCRQKLGKKLECMLQELIEERPVTQLELLL